MTMLLLKRSGVPLDRDVIFLAEAGEEGTTRVGIQFMVQQHFAEIDAEYCLAEGGSVLRSGGRVRYASVQTAEKIPHGILLTATGTAGHGSVPLETNSDSQADAGGRDGRDLEAADSAQRHDARRISRGWRPSRRRPTRRDIAP